MSASSNLARATANSIEARQQLAATMVDLQSRLAPARLIREGLDELRDGAAEAGTQAIQAVRERPGQAIGLVVGIVLFLARDQIADLFAKSVKPGRSRRVEPSTRAKPRKDVP